MAGIGERLTEGITTVALAWAVQYLAVVVAEVPLETPGPQAYVDSERGRFDGTFALRAWAQILVEYRLAARIPNGHEPAVLVRLEHCFRLREQPTVVAFDPEPGWHGDHASGRVHSDAQIGRRQVGLQAQCEW